MLRSNTSHENNLESDPIGRVLLKNRHGLGSLDTNKNDDWVNLFQDTVSFISECYWVLLVNTIRN